MEAKFFLQQEVIIFSQRRWEVRLKNIPTHFTIVFEDYEDKARFLSGLGINEDNTIIKAKEFI